MSLNLSGSDNHNGCKGTISLFSWIVFYTFTTSLIFCFSSSVSGVQQADEEEMKLMASTPFGSHIYSAANFNVIKNVQKQLITQVCAGVDDQLNSLVSGEEGELW